MAVVEENHSLVDLVWIAAVAGDHNRHDAIIMVVPIWTGALVVSNSIYPLPDGEWMGVAIAVVIVTTIIIVLLWVAAVDNVELDLGPKNRLCGNEKHDPHPVLDLVLGDRVLDLDPDLDRDRIPNLVNSVIIVVPRLPKVSSHVDDLCHENPKLLGEPAVVPSLATTREYRRHL